MDRAGYSSDSTHEKIRRGKGDRKVIIITRRISYTYSPANSSQLISMSGL